MRLTLRHILFLGAVLTLQGTSVLFAQERCATVEYNRTLYPNPAQRKIEFEKWLLERIAPQLPGGRRAQEQAMPYKVPVVVHVIHNGEAMGTGPNISEAQILSQIRVLNEDFQRQNADAVNTPVQFTGVAGSLDIEFVLARQDPDGIATSGIVRVNGGRSGWTINDNYALKSLSYWPAENYMNIWVCNLVDGYAGFAQFPESTIPGMENSSTNRLTDGLVIWHKAFGSSDDGSFTLDPAFNKGRTTTHEAGHFFGLNHIWGDESDCVGTDYVTDTPNQADQTQGCPAHPKADKCSPVVMFQNYLDYTNDVCMNLFTQGQVSRMVTVIENSPRRKTLLTSPGLLAPAPVANDIGIRSIVSPDASVCSTQVTPVIELRNYGSNLITSARIRFILDGSIQETKDFSLSLDPSTSTQASFSPVTITSGTHAFTFQVLLTNGGTDGAAYNDEKFSTVIVPAFGSAPFAENFNVPPAGWITQNPDGQITWQIVTAPGDVPTNKALKLNYFDYEDKLGEIDIYLSPIIDLSAAPVATLTFEVAHARFQSSNDRLKVVVLTDCQPLSEGTVVYNKAGDTLKTAPSTTSAFTPSGPTQWRKELISLSAFVGMDKVQLAFVGINDWGNNIYVDNITLSSEETRDVHLVRLANPSVVTCQQQTAPRILVQNLGSEILNDLEVLYSVNGGATQNTTLSNINLPFGQEKVVDLPAVNLANGLNTLFVSLQNPNGWPDINPGDNDKSFSIVLNQDEDRIPLRENFDGIFTPAWTAINPTGGMNWQIVTTNFDKSLYFNAYNNNVLGDEAWLVSPVLDFSRTTDASMLFDLSHANRTIGETTLTILGSTDCGYSFQELAYNRPAANWANVSWKPDETEDWARNVAVNLNALAGNENVRIAFVVRTQQGNNLYLDNIEFFVTSDPDPIEIAELYSVYGYDLTNPGLSDLRITFNLPERQDFVRFSIFGVTGQFETDGMLTDVLNQTFDLDLEERLPPGVYFVRVQIGEKFHTTKVLVH